MDESINLDLCNPKSLKGPFEPCQLISMIYDIMYLSGGGGGDGGGGCGGGGGDGGGGGGGC